MSLRYFSICLILGFAACVKTDDTPAPTDLGYAYFPTAIGTFVEYRADSIYHDQPNPDIDGVHDTTVFFIREVIESEFEDAMGEPSLRIERYKKSEAEAEWELSDVWFAKTTARNAQKVEENIRFVKMAFPISLQAVWDGNALNPLDTWSYQYDSLYVPRNFGGQPFPETVKVLQRDNKNFVEDELAYEIYAKNVGLVFRYFKDLDTQLNYTNFPTAANIRLGIEYKWELIDYGIE